MGESWVDSDFAEDAVRRISTNDRQYDPRQDAAFVDPLEHRSFLKYTGSNSSWRINRGMRRGLIQELKDEDQETIEGMLAAMRPSDHRHVTYRGSPNFKIEGTKRRFLDMAKVGSVLPIDQFMSTSRDLKHASAFGNKVLLEVSNHPQAQMAIMPNALPTYESETIYNSGQQLRITAVHPGVENPWGHTVAYVQAVIEPQGIERSA